MVLVQTVISALIRPPQGAGATHRAVPQAGPPPDTPAPSLHRCDYRAPTVPGGVFGGKSGEGALYGTLLGTNLGGCGCNDRRLRHRCERLPVRFIPFSAAPLRSIGWFACEPSEHHHLFLIQILISQQITTLPRALAGHSARSVPITTKTPTAVLLAYTNLVPVRRSKAST